MTDIDDDNDEWPRDPASAIELLELHLIHQHWNPNPETVAIPRDAAQIILQCAQKGLHKGRGRRGVSLSHGDKMRRDSVVLWAEERKAELQAANSDLSDAEAKRQAAAEASRLLYDRYKINLAAETIRLRMKRRAE
jgi:hypothetical protein